MIGVHHFQVLNVTGGADVDFGTDRIVIDDPANSSVGANSTLRFGEMFTVPATVTGTLVDR